MSQISQEEIGKIKSLAPIGDLIRSSGVDLTTHGGKDLAGSCPFHEDKTPSLIISPDKNLWHCMSCGEGGSVIDWQMKTKGLSFLDAVASLREKIDTGSVAKVIAKPTVDLHDSSVQEALKEVIAHYEKKLNDQALRYLEGRGFKNPKLLSDFKVGYCDRSIHEILPSRKSQTGQKIRKILQNIGILRDSGHEHFAGYITIPIFDTNGQIMEVYGRRIATSDSYKHLYLPGPHKGIFNHENIEDGVILCESMIDAMTFYSAGQKNVSCSFGTGGMTEELLSFLAAKKVKTLFIAYDNDQAGNRASERLKEKVKSYKITVHRVNFPVGLDANEYYQRSEDKDALALLIARSLGEESTVQLFPGGAKKTIKSEHKGDTSYFSFNERRYRLKGLKSSDTYLKTNLTLYFRDNFHMDSLDLYAARQRKSFALEAESMLGLSKDEILQDLNCIIKELEVHEKDKGSSKKEKTLSPEEKREALEFLRSKNLMDLVLEAFDCCGVVGEEVNKLTGYIAAISRKMDKPLAILIQSSSAAGKSSLMDAILELVPEEDRSQYSAMTGQSLFYMEEDALKHKILALSEEEGVGQASYALKLLQSQGELRIASTGSDPKTGKLVTHEYRVEGPVMLFMTTTSIEIDEELRNRCIVLTVDESPEQTRMIHDLQRQQDTLEGLILQENRKRTVALHRNAQRLLRAIKVVNPFAEKLTFNAMQTRSRRDNRKYLDLIKSITLLHQYQRPVKVYPFKGRNIEYIEVTVEDIKIANKIAHEVLGRSLDELPPQTRKLLSMLNKMRGSEKHFSFSRKEVREFSGWTFDQVKVHLTRLLEMEYVTVLQGKRGQRLIYELNYDQDKDSSQNFFPGLINPEEIKRRGSSNELGYPKDPSWVPHG